MWSTLGPVPATMVLPLFLSHLYAPKLVSFQPHKPASNEQGPWEKQLSILLQSTQKLNQDRI